MTNPFAAPEATLAHPPAPRAPRPLSRRPLLVLVVLQFLMVLGDVAVTIRLAGIGAVAPGVVLMKAACNALLYVAVWRLFRKPAKARSWFLAAALASLGLLAFQLSGGPVLPFDLLFGAGLACCGFWLCGHPAPRQPSSEK